MVFGKRCCFDEHWSFWSESSEEGAESSEEGAESAEEGAESAEEGAESAEEGAESAEEGGESMMVPEGTWLLWTETPGCEDFDLLSTKLASAKYAVFTVASDGASEMLFYDSSYEVFRTYSFPTVGLAEAESFEISLVESVEEPEGSGCTINRDMTLTLTLSLGAWVGSLEYSELKKGGGCFSDGCEGSMVIKTQELGSAVNPLYVEGQHPFAYENAGDGVSETGTMLFYAVPEQPYYFELDITTVGSSLQTIRGQKYIAGQGGRLWGRASELSFSACPGVYNSDHWDVDINMEAGPAFGGTLEHRTETYEEDCFALETSTLGTLTAR